MNAKTSPSNKAAVATQEALEKAENELREVEERARQTLDDARAQAEQLKAQTSTQIKRSMGTVENYVKSNPLQAAGIAFFAGVLAASLIKK